MIRFLLTLLFCLTLSGAEEIRAVSLSPAVTELVCQLGCERFLAGRSGVCNYPSSVRNLPVMGQFGDPDVERILRLKATHLLSNDLVNPGTVRIFERAGIRVCLKQCRNMEDYMQWVDLLGKEFRCPEKAAAELKRIRHELDNLKKTSPVRKRKAVWVIWDSPMMLAGRGSLPDSVMTLAGMENLAGNVKQEYFKASYDWLLRNPPEVIIWSCSRKLDPSHKFWKHFDAVKQNHVISDIPEELLLRPGPRLPEGIRLLRKKMEVCR